MIFRSIIENFSWSKKAQTRKEQGFPCLSPVSSLSSNDILVWEDMKGHFLALYKLARSLFCVAASSDPCERLLFKTGTIVSQKRNRISPLYIDKLLFLSETSESEFFT